MAENQIPVTTREVAAHFHVAVSTVRKWVRGNQIPFIRVNRRIIRFYLKDVEAALAGGKGAGDAK